MSNFSRRVCCCLVDDVTRKRVEDFGALCFFYCSSIALTLYNKWLFVAFGLKYPLSVTSIHMTASFLCAVTVQRFRRGKWEIGVTSGAIKKCMGVGLFVGMDIALTNSSFLYVSVPFIEMVKSACPLWVLILSLSLGIEAFSCALIAIMITISGGLCLSVYGAANFDLTGFIMCLTASVMAACRLVASHKLLHADDQRGEDKMDSWQMLAVMAPVSGLVMLVPAVAMEMDDLRKSSFATDPRLFKEASLAVLGGALLAVNLNLSEFIFLGRTSALTMNVAAIFKVLIVSISSTVLFNAKVTLLNGIGYAVCMLGVISYNVLKLYRKDASPYAVVQPSVAEGDAVPLTQPTEAEADSAAAAMENGSGQAEGRRQQRRRESIDREVDALLDDMDD